MAEIEKGARTNSAEHAQETAADLHTTQFGSNLEIRSNDGALREAAAMIDAERRGSVAPELQSATFLMENGEYSLILWGGETVKLKPGEGNRVTINNQTVNLEVFESAAAGNQRIPLVTTLYAGTEVVGVMSRPNGTAQIRIQDILDGARMSSGPDAENAGLLWSQAGQASLTLPSGERVNLNSGQAQRVTINGKEHQILATTSFENAFGKNITQLYLDGERVEMMLEGNPPLKVQLGSERD